jgi:hypothetical protein
MEVEHMFRVYWRVVWQVYMLERVSNDDLQEIPFDKNLKLVSFDIENMYSNICIKALIELLM